MYKYICVNTFSLIVVLNQIILKTCLKYVFFFYHLFVDFFPWHVLNSMHRFRVYFTPLFKDEM